jgi:hypothetical protein
MGKRQAHNDHYKRKMFRLLISRLLHCIRATSIINRNEFERKQKNNRFNIKNEINC